MSLASGVRVRLSYVEESTMGTTPGTPSMKTLRCISKGVNLGKNMLQSEEVNENRMETELRHGFNSVGGTIGFELSREAYDDFLRYAMGGTWATVEMAGGPSVSVDATTDVFTRMAGSFITDGFRVGDVITTTGFTEVGNNGTFRVISVTATTLGVDAALTTETSGTGKAIHGGKRINIGTTLKTVTIEKAFLDVAQYQPLRGCAITAMSINVTPERIVGGEFTIVGMSAGAMSGSSLGSPSAAPANSPFDAFRGEVYEGGVKIAIVTGITVNLDNGRNVQAVVGSVYSPEVFDGTAKVEGTLTLFFQNATMFNKFVNETEASVWVRLDDLNGTDYVNLILPRIKYTAGELNPPQEGPITLSMPFKAIRDSVSGTSFSIQKSNV